jgi:hypothetical protein
VSDIVYVYRNIDRIFIYKFYFFIIVHIKTTQYFNGEKRGVCISSKKFIVNYRLIKYCKQQLFTRMNFVVHFLSQLIFRFVFEYFSFSKTLLRCKYLFSFIVLLSIPVDVIQLEENEIYSIGF